MSKRFLYSFFLAVMIMGDTFPIIEQPSPPAATSPVQVAGTAAAVLGQSVLVEQPAVVAPVQPRLSDQLSIGTVIALAFKRLRGASRYLTGSLNDSNPLVQLKAGMASGKDVYQFTVMENNNGMLALAVVSTGYGNGSMGITSVRYLGIEAARARLVTLPGAPQYFELVGSSLDDVRLKCATNGGFVTYQNGLGIVASATSEAQAYPFAIVLLAQPQSTLQTNLVSPSQRPQAPQGTNVQQPVVQQSSGGSTQQQISQPIPQQSNFRGQGRR